MLLLAPAVPIAVAARYQVELVPGLAYIPVFIEGFGVALVVTALAWLVAPRIPRAR
jgi:hypothetical protein